MNKIIKTYGNDYQLEDAEERYLVRRLSDGFVTRAIEKSTCSQEKAIEIEDKFYAKVLQERLAIQ